MNTVLCIDLQLGLPFLILHKLVHTCWTEALLWPIKAQQVLPHWNTVVQKGEVGRLVVLVVGPSQCHGGEEVKADLPIWLWVADGCGLPRLHKAGMVWFVVLQRPRLAARSSQANTPV